MNPLARLLAKRRMERDLAEEMAEHLAEKIQRLRDDGRSAEEAERMARLQFGNLTQRKEDSREAWGWNIADQLWQDLRFGVRVLAKAPSFTVTAVVVLALGIGMNTAMFSAVKAVLLSALPYPDPEQIVQLNQTAKDGHLMNVSALDFNDWRARTHSLQSMAKYGVDVATISGKFPARRTRTANVGSGFFDVMRTGAVVGRTFAHSDQTPGAVPTLIVGYEFAQAVFGSPGNAIGRPVRLDGLPFTVIGVMPPHFDFPEKAEAWLPNDLFPEDTGRSAHNYRVVARMKPGTSVAQAQSELTALAAGMAKEYVDDKDEGIRATPLFDALVGDVRPALFTLLGAVSLVLLIACINISNLQLARAASRNKEMSMRRALGAGPSRLVRQLLTENILLGLSGGLLGLLLAEGIVKLIRIAPANIPRLETLHIDSGVLCFTAGVSVLAGILFGLLPSFEISKGATQQALKQRRGQGVPQKRWIQILIVSQIALAIVLLSGAALLLKSYWKLSHVDTGLSSSSVFVTDVVWPVAADGNSVDGNYVRHATAGILSRIEQLPGIRAAGLIYGLPFEGAPDGDFEIEGRPLPADPHANPNAVYRMITPGFLTAFGLPVLQGRTLTPQDDLSDQQVALVNQTFEKQFFPRGNVIGRRIRFLGFDRKPRFMTVVGVVPNVRALGLRQPDAPEVYADFLQHADTAMNVSLVVRGPAGLQHEIEQIVTSLDPVTAVNFRSMDHLISGTIARERFQTALLTVFAASALLLATVGVYGLLSYTVARSTGELGIRMALGATAAAIAGIVLRQGGLLILTGVTLGIIGSLGATRVLESMLFDEKTIDVSALLAVAACFLGTGLIACYLPARRASAIQPSEALRAD